MTITRKAKSLQAEKAKAVKYPVEYLDRIGHPDCMLEGLPGNLREPYARWYLFGAEPSQFLRAVIDNDLFMAMASTDRWSIKQLRETVFWFIDHAPAACHKGRAQAWQDAGGWIGRAKERGEL